MRMKCIASLALKEKIKDAYRTSARKRENKKESTWGTLAQMGSNFEVSLKEDRRVRI
jgi:hypothetical protein